MAADDRADAAVYAFRSMGRTVTHGRACIVCQRRPIGTNGPLNEEGWVVVSGLFAEIDKAIVCPTCKTVFRTGIDWAVERVEEDGTLSDSVACAFAFHLGQNHVATTYDTLLVVMRPEYTRKGPPPWWAPPSAQREEPLIPGVEVTTDVQHFAVTHHRLALCGAQSWGDDLTTVRNEVTCTYCLNMLQPQL